MHANCSLSRSESKFLRLPRARVELFRRQRRAVLDACSRVLQGTSLNECEASLAAALRYGYVPRHLSPGDGLLAPQRLAPGDPTRRQFAMKKMAAYFRRVDISLMNRGDAAAATFAA